MKLCPLNFADNLLLFYKGKERSVLFTYNVLTFFKLHRIRNQPTNGRNGCCSCGRQSKGQAAKDERLLER